MLFQSPLYLQIKFHQEDGNIGQKKLQWLRTRFPTKLGSLTFGKTKSILEWDLVELGAYNERSTSQAYGCSCCLEAPETGLGEAGTKDSLLFSFQGNELQV